ncbi:exodeoxyribonuclease VII small subunit [Chitinibacter bivalviorum]|uniref:Exodeoxyribonuclease 7 small subunit n=1 Tax=Chitinibacter bivalviorum TaxID=2739434 RepID=A0A7H9BG69_9NEIS|nr:exodeoxyribonuclease VII small subunit [Chitinibacter bivalviorum]QLG87208.1 exodeoxyribonuclease VII small subunit [Chitinibacter bivalviorum]
MAKAAAKPNLPESYEAGVAELDALIAQMEGGQLPLEASLAAYQRGTELLRFCESKLAAAEQQVKILEAGELKAMPDAGA